MLQQENATKKDNQLDLFEKILLGKVEVLLYLKGDPVFNLFADSALLVSSLESSDR